MPQSPHLKNKVNLEKSLIPLPALSSHDFKMYSPSSAQLYVLIPSCSSNYFPGEFSLGSLQVCSISKSVPHTDGSHIAHPGSRKPQSQSLDAKDPKAKVSRGKECTTLFDRTGRTGPLFCTFLIAHPLLFLSDSIKAHLVT